MNKKRKLMKIQLSNLITFALCITNTSLYGYFLAKYRDEYSKGTYHFMVAGTIVFGVLSLLIAIYMMLVQIFYDRTGDDE